MAKRLDQIVVVDVESTCWDGPPPAGQESEIIEIGVCTVDVASAERLEREAILVAPRRSTVSEFCTGLTTLTQQQVERGGSFAEACGPTHINVKTRFAVIHSLPEEVGMDAATTSEQRE